MDVTEAGRLEPRIRWILNAPSWQGERIPSPVLVPSGTIAHGMPEDLVFTLSASSGT
jgi:hypothetical protein